MQLLHRSASLASFNCVSLWLCQQIAGAPFVTSFSCALLKGTACTQEPPPSFLGWWAAEWPSGISVCQAEMGQIVDILPLVELTFAKSVFACDVRFCWEKVILFLCVLYQILLCWWISAGGLPAHVWGGIAVTASSDPVLPDHCWGLAEASESICPALLNHFGSLFFSFPAFPIVGRPEEMVIFAEVICPLWTLFGWADVLHSLRNETSARCHQRDKFCPQMNEWARDSELCTCVWWPCVSHLLSTELRGWNPQAQCWESVLQYLWLLFNFNLSRSFASRSSYN